MTEFDLHEAMYSDQKRVREARVQAEGMIALRKLRQFFIESWAVPAVDLVARRFDSAIWPGARRSRETRRSDG